MSANPILPYGGLPFGSKTEISSHFRNILPYRLIKKAAPIEKKMEMADTFMAERSYPVIVKPDIGHRGVDIHLARSRNHLTAILKRQTWDYQLQEYCDYPLEFGIFYSRIPGRAKGEIISLTQKQIPVLNGDGKSTIEELILASDIINKKAIIEAVANEKATVLESEQQFRTLVGASHARGSMFFDVKHMETPELLQATHEVCIVDGFYFGRLDVKAVSKEAFLRGEYKIIEVNGATSECIHIYDNAVSFLEGLRVLKEQWETLFQIASLLRGSIQPLSLLRFLVKYKNFYKCR